MVRTAFVAGVVAWFVVANTLALAEHYYLRYFGEPFGPKLFSVFDDDVAIASDAATHFLPVGMALTSAACLGAVQAWCTFRWALVPERGATWRDAVVQVLVVSTLLVVGWGRPAARLVDREGISVAREPMLDDLLVNTPVRLTLALMRASAVASGKTSPQQAAREALRSHGFADAAALVKALASEGALDLSKGATPDEDPNTTLLRAPWHRTPLSERLAAHPPHVVFGLIEGWGGYGLSLDADGFPIAGAMRRHLEAGWWFRHAVAARADTFSAIEHLLINSGSPALLLTNGDKPVAFDAAAARPFQQRGYRTVFVYGGARTWRNIDRVMRRQGFDDVVTQAEIVARYPQADTGSYGVYDGYLWRYVHDMLEDADAKGQPLFVFALTMSNHWPFNVPGDAATGPFDLTKGWRASPASEAEREARQRGVRAYRYAMDALGDFIDRLKYSPMSSHTILAATGDHRAPQWRNQDNASLSPFEQYHVPIYLRVPPRYTPAARLRLDDFVGHRDIFPTLYTLALSDTPYVGFGEPLFGPVPPTRRYAVAQQRYLFSTAGARDLRSGVTYMHAEGGDPGLLGQQALDANASLALADWYSEMQRGGKAALAAPPASSSR
ncbi:LTA synthase family protein [Pandoraea anhela]|uniref:Lipoteichoic acid synthase 1 n=1 Tax=Pandoraea anhela TaxID=2508295 RepID=A0A5E4YJG1_9BURK|nr:LTA synthase family protein [Pandoraea anhela]VVE48891.1 Lipoteichoic acid synthase 1 [Pandoraea anhela]